jgi:NhaP-type Na+/H+ or K+/H+ antiporter
MLRPSVGSGLVVSWAGMRGIVTLAAAMALPANFPLRDLIMLTAFAVVLGTLLIQGLTLKPLLRRLNVRDDDPVGREVTAARKRALQAGLASFAGDSSPAGEFVRQAFTAHLGDERSDAGAEDSAHRELYRRALDAARKALHAMRTADEIGDDAFHQIEEQLDRLESAVGKDDE